MNESVEKEKNVKTLYEQYAKKLFAYASFNWKTDEDVTWDLVYKTLYKVTEVKDKYTFDNEQKFSAFIFKTFINYLRNHLRDTRTASGGITEVPLEEHLNSEPAKQEKEVHPTAQLRLLQQELDKMEDWQRILLLMRSQNIPYAEISKMTGKPESQLKVYYGRLKDQLAAKIQARMKDQKIQPHEQHKY